MRYLRHKLTFFSKNVPILKRMYTKQYDSAENKDQAYI